MKQITLNSSENELLQHISDLIRLGRQSVERQINMAMTYTYFEIGRYIVEHEQNTKERAEYAQATVEKLAQKLTEEFGKGFSERNLQYARKFYNTYKGQISQTVFAKSIPFSLTWSHYLMLMSIDNEAERKFYEIEATEGRWSVREMKRQYNSSLYERLALSKNKEKIKQLSVQGQLLEKPEDLLKEPLVLEFLNMPEPHDYSENDLETAIINKIEKFMLELGKGFLFESRQKRISFAEEHYRIDLVFYNRLLRCFVVIDLKIGRLTHQDLGQMQMYVNYYDRFIKTEDENPTIGIILCKNKEQALVEITLPKDNNQIFATKYQLYLPDKEELRRQIESL
jgi:predicted nuclease of restriction endonuclease-like (RecB) superfamily